MVNILAPTAYDKEPDPFSELIFCIASSRILLFVIVEALQEQSGA